MSSKKEVCPWKLGYLHESGNGLPPETYKGYIEQGCDKCDGKNKECEIYTLLYESGTPCLDKALKLGGGRI